MLTGNGIINDVDDGVFKECQARTRICGYSCCKFGKLGNWIYTLPGEVEQAKRRRYSFAHLELEALPDSEGGGYRAICKRPCEPGELKPIDCMIYPLFPANLASTQFIVADHRKCPVPNKELIAHALKVQRIVLEYESSFPGSIRGMLEAGKRFKAYCPFPYEVTAGKARLLDEPEKRLLAPYEMLSDEYRPEWATAMPLDGYSASSTPDD